MMDGAAVKELAERFRQPMEIGGNIAYPHDWKVVDPSTIIGATPTSLDVYTLGAVRDYITANRDELPLGSIVVHVVSPQVVTLQGSLRETERVRETYVKATAHNLMDGFLGKFMSQEEFIIGMQSRFDSAGDRQAVLTLAGSMTAEAVNTSNDDGIGQTVTARAGVALKATVTVPNPVTLRPFRTFREVEQPDSLFVLRVNQSMQLGLFEADGGAWRLVAIERLRAWLVANLPTTVAVLA